MLFPRKLVDGIRRRTADETATQRLLTNIEGDLKKGGEGTALVGKILRLQKNKLLPTFNAQQNKLIQSTLRQVNNNIEVGKLNNVKSLNKQFRDIVSGKTPTTSKKFQDQLESWVGRVEDLYALQDQFDQLQVPGIMKQALRNPTNNDLKKQALEALADNAPIREQFVRLHNKSNQLKRVMGISKAQDKVISAVGEIDQELAKELQINAQFIGEVGQLLDEKKLLKILEDRTVLSLLGRNITSTDLQLTGAALGLGLGVFDAATNNVLDSVPTGS